MTSVYAPVLLYRCQMPCCRLHNEHLLNVLVEVAHSSLSSLGYMIFAARMSLSAPTHSAVLDIQENNAH